MIKHGYVIMDTRINKRVGYYFEHLLQANRYIEKHLKGSDNYRIVKVSSHSKKFNQRLIKPLDTQFRQRLEYIAMLVKLGIDIVSD